MGYHIVISPRPVGIFVKVKTEEIAVAEKVWYLPSLAQG